MLTTATRAYTEAELDEYSDRMGSRATTLAAIVTIAVIVGGLSTLGAYAVHWLYTWLTSWLNPGSATWTYPLIVGGGVTVLIVVGLWFALSSDDWTHHPPELATDVTATAYAAWETENDSLDTVLVFRVEPDRYLLLVENALTPPIRDEKAPKDTIPSNIRLVLLGEGDFRIALDVSLTGHAIPLAHTDEILTDEDRDDETPFYDGLYITAELPARIRRAIGVA
jgi:hypothetical protein